MILIRNYSAKSFKQEVADEAVVVGRVTRRVAGGETPEFLVDDTVTERRCVVFLVEAVVKSRERTLIVVMIRIVVGILILDRCLRCRYHKFAVTGVARGYLIRLSRSHHFSYTLNRPAIVEVADVEEPVAACKRCEFLSRLDGFLLTYQLTCRVRRLTVVVIVRCRHKEGLAGDAIGKFRPTDESRVVRMIGFTVVLDALGLRTERIGVTDGELAVLDLCESRRLVRHHVRFVDVLAPVHRVAEAVRRAKSRLYVRHPVFSVFAEAHNVGTVLLYLLEHSRATLCLRLIS